MQGAGAVTGYGGQRHVAELETDRPSHGGSSAKLGAVLFLSIALAHRPPPRLLLELSSPYIRQPWVFQSPVCSPASSARRRCVSIVHR